MAENPAQQVTELGHDRIVDLLRSDSDRFDDLVGSLTVGVIVVDRATGAVLYLNEEATRLRPGPFPLAGDLRHHGTRYTALHPNGRPYQDDEWPLARVFASGEQVRNEEIEFRFHDDGSRRLRVSASPLLGDDGRVELGIVTFTTAQTRGGERAHQLDDAFDALALACSQDDVVNALLSLGIPALGAESGSVLFTSEDDRMLEVAGVLGDPVDGVEDSWAVSVSDVLPVTDAARLQTPVWLDSPAALVSRYPGLASAVLRSGEGSWAAIPVSTRRRVAVVIFLGFGGSFHLGVAEQAAALSLAHDVGRALDRASIFRAEVEQRASAAERGADQFRLALEASPDGFALFRSVRDAAGRIVDFEWIYTNAAGRRLIGPRGGARGERMLVHNPGMRDSGIFDDYVRVVNQGITFSKEFHYSHEWHDAWFHVTAVKVNDGFALTFADVTERMRATDRLQTLQRLTAALGTVLTRDAVLRVVLEQGVAAVHATGGAVALFPPGNDAVLDVVRSTGVLDWVLLSAGPRIDMGTVLPVTDAVRLNAPVWIESTGEMRDRYPATARALAVARYEAWAALPLAVDSELFGALVLGFRDVRYFSADERDFLTSFAHQCGQALERARLYEAEQSGRAEAEVADQTKSDFLATMSHELRTPLNTIAGYAELLAMGIHGPVTPEQLNDLRRIQRSEQHLLVLLNDVLSFAKLGSGQVGYDVTVIAAHAALSELEDLIAPQLAAKRLHYAYHPCDRSLQLLADADKLRQIMLNLLSNAIKFTSDGGLVTVRCDADAATVHIQVQDTGIGIPADQMGVIFEPFVQVNQRLNHPGEGVGLGLAISRTLARGMGGDLTVESVVGVGTVFTLTLPRAP